MTAPRKLTHGEVRMLELVQQDSNWEGWTPISKVLYSLVDQLPKALVEIIPHGAEGRGLARLTKEGNAVLSAKEWLP